MSLILATLWKRERAYLRFSAERSNLLDPCKTMHKSLKHSAVYSRLGFWDGCNFGSILQLSTFSHRFNAVATNTDGEYFLEIPSKSAVSSTYLQKLRGFSERVSQSSAIASRSWSEVVRLRLKLRVSMMLPSMFLRSATV